MKRLIGTVLLIILLPWFGLWIGTVAELARPQKKDAQKEKAVLLKSWGKFPIQFIANQGQADSRISFYVKGKDKTLYFDPQGLTFSLSQFSKSDKGLPVNEADAAIQRWNVKLQFQGTSENARLEGVEKSETKISYFKGAKDNWKTNIPTYQSIAYRELWPGVDVVYHGNIDVLKHDFIVKPGADPSRIQLAYAGAEGVNLTGDGSLEIDTPVGSFQDEKPVAYQMIDGEKRDVPIEYDLQKKSDRYEYSFLLGAYDRSRELVIDPATVIYAGFIGGDAGDVGQGIAVDGTGAVYVTGYTDSTQATFPETIGPDLTSNAQTDAFVAKVSADGTTLVYAGFIGGNADDSATGIAVDGNGAAYVTGSTESTEVTFPETAGPDLTSNGASDAFVAKINPAGTLLTYCGYIGGSANDFGNGIAVDGNGSAYVVGQTSSTEADFPDVGGPDLFQNGDTDAFVAKVAADGLSLTYAGFIGGSFTDSGNGIAVDGNGSAYVVGDTQSTEADFPTSGGPDLFQNGLTDAFVAKVAADGASLTYSGFVGGAANDSGTAITVDASGSAYIVGWTVSSEATFPETVGPGLTWSGNTDAFVAKVAVNGILLDYAGYIGGVDGSTRGYGIAVDGNGNAYAGGETNTTGAAFPAGGNGPATSSGGVDSFVVKINSVGDTLDYTLLFGGDVDDNLRGIAVDSNGDAYVTGLTASTEATFPETGGPDLFQNGGTSDAFVAKIGIVAICGDTVVEVAEECDDGNADDTDVCPSNCLNASCGDGFVRSGIEACDDGNADETDSCLSTCLNASCGDGFVRSGVEACDDGNALNTDSCTNACALPTCGDGIVQTGEECDDGNADETDSCLATCLEPTTATDGTGDTGDTGGGTGSGGTDGAADCSSGPRVGGCSRGIMSNSGC